jgi:hypothetical protein
MQIIREELPEEKKSPVEMHWKKPPIIKPDIPKPVEIKKPEKAYAS